MLNVLCATHFDQRLLHLSEYVFFILLTKLTSISFRKLKLPIEKRKEENSFDLIVCKNFKDRTFVTMF